MPDGVADVSLTRSSSPLAFDSAEVTTCSNADKKKRSKQRTRKAIVPLSTADETSGDDTYDDDNIEEAEAEVEVEVEEAEAEAAAEEAAP
jgi:hypothetical protein